MKTILMDFFLVLVLFDVLITTDSKESCSLELVTRVASHDGCQKQMVTVNACRGACLSATESLVNPPWHKTTCTCCRQNSALQTKTVTLKCNGGKIVTQSFTSATSCRCSLC